MSRRAYGGFLLLTLAWLAAAALVYGARYLDEAIVWWGLLVMLVAAGYYLIQEAPAARVTGWLRRDLAINALLFLALLFAILDGSFRFPVLGLRAAGWTAFAAAALHPLLVDLPHRRHHAVAPDLSPVPMYVPPACLWIDWTLAVLVGVGQLLL